MPPDVRWSGVPEEPVARRFAPPAGAQPPTVAVASALAAERLHFEGLDVERGAPGLGLGE